MKWYHWTLIIIGAFVLISVGYWSVETREQNLTGTYGVPTARGVLATLGQYHMERTGITKHGHTGGTGFSEPCVATGNKWLTIVFDKPSYHDTLEAANLFLAEYGWAILPGPKPPASVVNGGGFPSPHAQTGQAGPFTQFIAKMERKVKAAVNAP